MVNYHANFISGGVMFGIWQDRIKKSIGYFANTALWPIFIVGGVMLFGAFQPGNHSDVGFMNFYPIYYDTVIQSMHTNGSWMVIYFLNWFEKTYGGKLYRVSIVHLSAGGKVYPHIDIGDYYKNKNRFHLVLSGYYNYTVDGETQRLGAGDLFWFNNKKIHSSANATPIPRISLVFDVEGCTI